MRTYDCVHDAWTGMTKLVVTIDKSYDEEDCKEKTTSIGDWRRAKGILDLLDTYPELVEKEEFTANEFLDIVKYEHSKKWLYDIRTIKIYNMLSNDSKSKVRLGTCGCNSNEDAYPIFKKVREENFKVKTPKYEGMGTRYYFAVDEEGVEILEDYVNMFAPCLIAREENKIEKERAKLERLQEMIEKKTKKIANLLKEKALLENGEI